MDLGKKIYELRKLNSITQEQLAKAVGVSTPAVSKWETGAALPDITLLAPIARKLNTDLDDLLSFRKFLSELEVKKIVDEIKELARTKGISAGLEASYEFLRKYPNTDELKLEVAMLPVMLAHTAVEEYRENEEKYQKIIDDSTALLEELLHSENERIRRTAIISVAVRYMEQNRLEEAEALLKKLPGQEFDTRHLYPSLYLMKGEEERVFEYSQANMLQDIQHLLVDIRSQHSVYLKKKEYDKALKCARDYLSLVQIAGTKAMCKNELLVDTYLAIGQREEAEKYFLDYLNEIGNISGNYQDSFYYSHIADKVVIASTDVEDDVRSSLIKLVLYNDKYSKLKEAESVKKKISELEKMIHE